MGFTHPVGDKRAEDFALVLFRNRFDAGKRRSRAGHMASPARRSSRGIDRKKYRVTKTSRLSMFLPSGYADGEEYRRSSPSCRRTKSRAVHKDGAPLRFWTDIDPPPLPWRTAANVVTQAEAYPLER